MDENPENKYLGASAWFHSPAIPIGSIIYFHHMASTNEKTDFPRRRYEIT